MPITYEKPRLSYGIVVAPPERDGIFPKHKGGVFMPLVLTLKQLALTNVNDPAGRWQFEGGQVFQKEEHVANYASVKRVTFHGTDQNGQNTAMVTTTLFCLAATNPPHNITLEGAHAFRPASGTASADPL